MKTSLALHCDIPCINIIKLLFQIQHHFQFPQNGPKHIFILNKLPICRQLNSPG